MPQPRRHPPISLKGSNLSKPRKVIWFRCYLFVAAVVLISLHVYFVSIIYYDLQEQYNHYRTATTSNHMFVIQPTTNHPPQPTTKQQGSFTPIVATLQESATTTTTATTSTFNNVPLRQVVGRSPKVTTVQCISPKSQSTTKKKNHENDDDKNDWMYRTCEYQNLCYDTTTRQYIAIVMNDTDNNHHHHINNKNHFPYVSIGGINPRWINSKTTISHHDTGSNTNVQKVRWKPMSRTHTTTTNNDGSVTSSYYEIPDEYIFIPFHSMAGHNIGHLLWDDLYAIYTALRLRNYMDPVVNHHQHNGSHSSKNKLLLLRHVLEGTNDGTTNQQQPQQPQLYANCDIRRNKRMQCKNNFERMLPYFGTTGTTTTIDPNTFFTTKTSQLLHRVHNVTTKDDSTSNDQAIVGVVPSSSSLVCFPKAIVGIGLLTDHGWYDHGWESTSQPEGASLSSSSPPHNLGRGRLFYDFTQYLLPQQQQSQTTLSTTTRFIPQITFSIESSRDWSRRLNFTNQIHALSSSSLNAESSGTVHSDFVVQTYRMYELSIQEQIDVAAQTSIFITVCGGGSMTTTFLPRNSVVILFYDPVGGHDYYDDTVHPNGLPARLDWDLLNNAAHLRVHWLPIANMDTPDHIELFRHLVRHELSTIHRTRTP